MDSSQPYGRGLLVNLVQQVARDGHHSPFALIGDSPDPEDGFHDFAYEELNKSAGRCAWLVYDTMRNTNDFTTFGWLGPVSDLRYFSMLLAAMRTRKLVFLPSPRNNL